MSDLLQKHPDYWLFHSMKKRCNCITSTHYAWYGARGIKVCERWLLPRGQGFKNFISDMGPRPQGYTLERKDNNGNYEPSNCVWASREEQYSNRRGNVKITLNGVTKTATQWANTLGSNRSDTVTTRLRNGMSIEDALTIKVGDCKRVMPQSAIDAAALKRKSRTHCKNGHEFTESNTYVYNGTRTCRTCKNIKYLNAKTALRRSI